MHVVLVTLDYLPYRSSGLAVYGELLARGLSELGVQVTVVCARHAGLSAREQIDGITVLRVPSPLNWIGLAWHAAPEAQRLLTQQADLIHFLDAHFAYRYRGPFLATLFQSFRQRLTSDGGLPYHSHLPGLLTRLAYYNLARWMGERPALRRAAHFLAASEATASEFRTHYGLAPEKMTVVPLGIDLARFASSEGSRLRRTLGLEQQRVILYVGFGTPRKGLAYLARALARLPEDVYLVMVGRWEPAYRHKFYAAAGPASSRVIESGYIDDALLPDYYAMADLFVFPSLLEGFGLPLVEALASGTPVVTTAGGPAEEIVGDAGRLVPARNPDALAQAITSLLGDPEACRQLSGLARQQASRYSYQRMARETLGVYESHLASRA